MASGHVNRIQRPNTWLHRPMLQNVKSSCQLGAVHTWHVAKFCCNAKLGRYRGKADIEQAAFHSIWLKLPTSPSLA
jgi:hypothetical protein